LDLGETRSRVLSNKRQYQLDRKFRTCQQQEEEEEEEEEEEAIAY
jgi:hypothetical protein